MIPRKMRRHAASIPILIALIATTSCSTSEAGGFHNHHHNQHNPFRVNHQRPNSNDHLRHPALASLFQDDQQMEASRTGTGGNVSSSVASSLSPSSTSVASSTLASLLASSPTPAPGEQQQQQQTSCSSGLLTFELSTGFIYKPSSAETLAMMPSTLQLTDCLEFCLQNSSCLAVNFEMGLCVLLSSSAKQNPTSLFSSQFPVFTIYAEKKCLLQGEPAAAKQRARCRRAWTFERAAGFEMKGRPRRRLRLASREQCMEACLGASDFECRSANWYRQTGECTLSDQDRHSVSQSEAGDQQLNAAHLHTLYGPAPPSNLTHRPPPPRATPSPLYQNYHWLQERMRTGTAESANESDANATRRLGRRDQQPMLELTGGLAAAAAAEQQQLPANAAVDYLENNCVIEPNKLCEFRKIQNRVLKTVDSIYQDVGSLEECKQRCLGAPYRCYSFDYGDTAERVCRTSHLDQASLLAVQDPYLEVAGAITYELASCFSVSIQCRAREMVAQVSSSKSFKGRIYAKSRPSSCVNDVRDSLQFELTMRYHDPDCDVHASSSSQQGVFSNDIVIQHHDRIVTTQDVGLSVYCQYDLGNRSITNNVNLAIDRIDDSAIESKNQPVGGPNQSNQSPLTITSLATTVVRSPNVTMRITNMNGQPVASATVGDRLALLFEIKEKTSPFGIFVREIIAMDGKQLLAGNNNSPKRGYHYSAAAANATGGGLDESAVESMFQANQNGANSVQFIDSDGCPTDANLMGPLVKMDPSGHRVLAPFDAFKFPTSDMVFFRAVVTSCVSECRPAVCPSATGVAPAPQPPLSADVAHFYSTTSAVLATTVSDVFGSATPTTATPTRLSTPRNSSPAPSVVQASTVAETSVRNKSRPNEPNSNWQLNDALTTTASLGGGQTPSLGTSTEAWPPATQQLQTSTNNVVQQAQNHSSSLPTSSNWLDSTTLNPNQRQQVIKLLEQRLQQQLLAGQAPSSSISNNNGSSMSEMAHLYANFLANLMLGAPNPPAKPAESGYRRDQSAANSFAVEQETVTARSTDTGASGVESSLIEQFGRLKLNSSELADLFKSVVLSALDAANRPEAAGNRQQEVENGANRAAGENNGSRIDVDVVANAVVATDGFEAPNAKLMMESSSSTTTTTTTQQPLPANRQRSNKPNRKLNAAEMSAAERRKANLQALADSYLGAYQSYGRRRKRSADYLLLRQRPLNGLAEVAPSALRHHKSLANWERRARFTGALVEMYLHDDHEGQRREKREVQPFYEMDELVVQSIKIVDRLQFKDEEDPSSMARASGLATQSEPEPNQRTRIVSWSSPGLLGAIVLASTFVFLQIFLVLFCLLDWHQRRRLSLARQQQTLARQAANSLAPRASPTASISTTSSMISQGRTLGRRDHHFLLNKQQLTNGHHRCAGCPAGRPPSHHHLT